MADYDQWDIDPKTGEMLVRPLSGFATACSPDGGLAVLRIESVATEDASDVEALQLALRPSHVRDLIEALTQLELKMIARQKPAGSA